MPSEVLAQLSASNDPIDREVADTLRRWQDAKEARGEPRLLGYEPPDINRYGAVEVVERRVRKEASGFEQVGAAWSYEAIVALNPERFSPEAVEIARARLREHQWPEQPKVDEETRSRTDQILVAVGLEHRRGDVTPLTQGVDLLRQANGRLRAEVFDGLRRDHVLHAIAQLQSGVNHPFGDPTTYQLLHEGQPYPPKAVFGLAAASLLKSPVGPADFSAGEGSVCFRLLRELGFEITRQDAGPAPLRHWALLANPLSFDIVRASEELDELTWILPNGDPTVGERLLFWKAKGPDEVRGVVAVGEVIEPPANRVIHADTAAYFVSAPPTGAHRTIVVRLLPIPAGPIWLGDEDDELINGFSVAAGQGNKLYSVTGAQWDELMARIGGWPGDALAMEDSIGIASARAGRSRGQGFSASPLFRRAVERRAMELVREHYLGIGYDVTDTSASRPYDYVVARSGERHFVEVKGTTGPGEQVFLTKNEVAHARAHAPHCVLAIVSGIQVPNGEGDDGPVADGGELRLLVPWEPVDSDLVALSFQYAVPKVP